MSVPRRALLPVVVAVSIGALLTAAALPVAAQSEGEFLDVPAEYPTIEAAIAASHPGDVVLVGDGIYAGGIVVPADKPGITIRGADRNTVVFDGKNTVENAIEVEADGVTLENMSAHDFAENGFYWDGADGFAGRYLTVWNVGLYGIYAIESRDGVIEQSYVSGAADAAFYIGECNPCDSNLHRNIATLSAVGFSGTNASGNLIVEDSIFENNGTGILPNSFDVGIEDAPPPQRGATFRGNVITGSGSVPVPRSTPLGGYLGIGIALAGAVDDVIDTNEVTGSARYGIVVVATVDRDTTWLPSGNTITNNDVSGSGTADLAIAAGGGANNCFQADNAAATTDPASLVGTCVPEGQGSATVAAELMRPPPELLQGLPDAPSYSTMPVPPSQDAMLYSPPIETTNVVVMGILALLCFAGGVACVYWARPKDMLDPRDLGNAQLRHVGAGLIILSILAAVFVGLLLAAPSG